MTYLELDIPALLRSVREDLTKIPTPKKIRSWLAYVDAPQTIREAIDNAPQDWQSIRQAIQKDAEQIPELYVKVSKRAYGTTNSLIDVESQALLEGFSEEVIEMMEIEGLPPGEIEQTMVMCEEAGPIDLNDLLEGLPARMRARFETVRDQTEQIGVAQLLIDCIFVRTYCHAMLPCPEMPNPNWDKTLKPLIKKSLNTSPMLNADEVAERDRQQIYVRTALFERFRAYREIYYWEKAILREVDPTAQKYRAIQQSAIETYDTPKKHRTALNQRYSAAVGKPIKVPEKAINRGSKKRLCQCQFCYRLRFEYGGTISRSCEPCRKKLGNWENHLGRDCHIKLGSLIHQGL
jgi:hypothetical protein